MSRKINTLKELFPHELIRIQQSLPIGSGKKKIFFTGTGRCGTTYISHVMQKLGFKFGHEVMKRHGQSSYKITPWLREIRAEGDAVIVRIYRDKQKTVESIIRQTYFEPGRVLYNGFIQVVPEILELKTYRERVNFYYDYWYKLSENCADFTFDIENFNWLDLKTILSAAGYDISATEIISAMEAVDPRENSNIHKSKNVDYDKKLD